MPFYSSAFGLVRSEFLEIVDLSMCPIRNIKFYLARQEEPAKPASFDLTGSAPCGKVFSSREKICEQSFRARPDAKLRS